MRIGRLVFLTSLYLTMGTLFSSPLHADVNTIEHIAEALRQWRSKFANLRVVYRQNSLDQLQPRFPHLSPEQLDGYYHRMEFIWTDYGPGRMDRTQNDDMVMVSRRVDFTNGKLVFGVDYGEGADGVKSTVAAGINTPRFKPQATLYGVRPLADVWYGSDRWLYERLEEFTAKLLREETLEGAPCVVMEIHPPAYVKKIMWLDSEHNYLPRRVEEHQEKYTPGTSIVEEFREAGPGVWFPSRGRYQPVAEPTWTDWHVEELQINATLPASLFELPPLSPGTRVSNHVENRHYTVGKPAAKPPSAAPQTASPLPPAQPISAVPSVNRTPIYFAVIAFLLAIMGLFLHFRQRR